MEFDTEDQVLSNSIIIFVNFSVMLSTFSLTSFVPLTNIYKCGHLTASIKLNYILIYIPFCILSCILVWTSSWRSDDVPLEIDLKNNIEVVLKVILVFCFGPNLWLKSEDLEPASQQACSERLIFFSLCERILELWSEKSHLSCAVQWSVTISDLF